MKKCLLVFIAVTTLWATALHAVEKNVVIIVELDKAFATIGDRLTYRISVIHPPDVQTLSYQPDNPLDDFEVKEVQSFGPLKTEKGWIQEGKRFIFTTFQVGNYTIGPVSVTYLDTDKKQKTIQSDKLYLTVESVIKERKPGMDIRDIKPVVDVPSRLLGWFIAAAAILGGGILAFFLIQLLKRKKVLEAAQEEPLLSAHEEAYQALAKLHDSNLIREGKIKEFYVQLSDIMRRYIHRRYLVETFDLTTTELYFKLKQIHVEDAVRKNVMALFEECDFVKFAKYRPDFKETLNHLRQARDIIDRTKVELVAPVPMREENQT